MQPQQASHKLISNPTSAAFISPHHDQNLTTVYLTENAITLVFICLKSQRPNLNDLQLTQHNSLNQNVQHKATGPQ